MYVVGGCRSNNTYYRDAYSYNFISKQWHKLFDIPLEIAYHSLITYKNIVYLYGGYNGVKFGSPHLFALDMSNN
jgi:N-acetylneuraminic acid mutarotase